MARLKIKDKQYNKQLIDRAALSCFTRSGFNGVTIRDIAKKAKLPLGSLYNYYEDKLTLFESLIADQSADFLSSDNKVIQYFLNSKFPEDLEKLAMTIKDGMDTYEPYFKLMYVDVVEFDGKHIREIFSNLDGKFKLVMANRFNEIGLLGPKKSIEPSFAMTAIYLSFYHYFILTKLFGATKVYGKRSDAEVVSQLLELFTTGIGRRVS